MLFYSLKVFFTGDSDLLESRAKSLEEVKTALRTQPMRYPFGNTFIYHEPLLFRGKPLLHHIGHVTFCQ